MTKEEFLKAIKYLTTSYDKDMTQDQVIIWYEFFKNVDFETFKKVIKRIVATERFMPSIAVVREELAKVTNEELETDGASQFEKVREAVRKYGIYRIEDLMNSLDEDTKEAVRLCGGATRFCQCEDQERPFLKKEFIDMFETNRKHRNKYGLLDNKYKTSRELSSDNKNINLLDYFNKQNDKI